MFPVPYLEAVVGLLEARTSHGIGARPLAAGPDDRSVRGLGNLCVSGVLDDLGLRLRLGSRDGRRGVELAGGGRERALADGQLAR